MLTITPFRMGTAYVLIVEQDFEEKKYNSKFYCEDGPDVPGAFLKWKNFLRWPATC